MADREMGEYDKNNRAAEILKIPAALFLMVDCKMLFRLCSVLKQESDCVNTCQSDDAEYDPADDRQLPAEQSADQIVSEKSDQTPIQCPNDH